MIKALILLVVIMVGAAACAPLSPPSDNTAAKPTTGSPDANNRPRPKATPKPKSRPATKTKRTFWCDEFVTVLSDKTVTVTKEQSPYLSTTHFCGTELTGDLKNKLNCALTNESDSEFITIHYSCTRTTSKGEKKAVGSFSMSFDKETGEGNYLCFWGKSDSGNLSSCYEQAR